MNRVSVAILYGQQWKTFRIPYRKNTTYDQVVQEAYRTLFHVHRDRIDENKVGKVHVFL